MTHALRKSLAALALGALLTAAAAAPGLADNQRRYDWTAGRQFQQQQQRYDGSRAGWSGDRGQSTGRGRRFARYHDWNGWHRRRGERGRHWYGFSNSDRRH